MRKLFLLSLFLVSLLVNAQINENALNLLHQMSLKSKEVKTIRYEAVMRERIDGKMVDKFSNFKINASPLKIYVKQSFVGIKIEALFNEGLNNNKMLVTTIGFPWIQINLDPKGKRVRDNHHHTIFEAGFAYFVNVVDQIIKTHYNDLIIRNIGTETKNGRECPKIQLELKNYMTFSYQVQDGENLTTIAKNFFVNDYKLLEINKGIDNFNDVKSRQVINIPNAYAQKMVLFLDPLLLLPVQIDIYDENGLYGSYFYKDLIVNEPFAWNEFNATNKDYHFH